MESGKKIALVGLGILGGIVGKALYDEVTNLVTTSTPEAETVTGDGCGNYENKGKNNEKPPIKSNKSHDVVSRDDPTVKQLEDESEGSEYYNCPISCGKNNF